MRIFYAVGSRPNSALSDSSIWRTNLFEALVRLGHEVIEFDFDLEPFYLHADPSDPDSARFIASNQSHLDEELLRQIAEAHRDEPVDVFFSYFYSAFVGPSTIRRIGDMGITTVNWYCNASYQFHLVSDVAPAYSFCLVPEKFRLEDYRRVGARPIYCQEAANPDFYHPYDLPREYGVTFVGAAYGDRPRYIRSLVDAGCPIRVWGPRWSDLAQPAASLGRTRTALSRGIGRALGRPETTPRLPAATCGGTLADEEMVKTFSRSKICLGFSSVGDTARSGLPVRQVRLRDFEVPMSGGFYMLEYLSEIEEFFVPDKEIVCFDGRRDLVAKVRYYLAHDEERQAIMHAGHERALRDHTWQTRLSQAFDQMAGGHDHG